MSGGDTTIVGYRYGKAEDLVCPECTYALFVDFNLLARTHQTTEELLDHRATQLGIRRQALNSYHAREFPQPIYLGEATESDVCVHCGQPLLDEWAP